MSLVGHPAPFQVGTGGHIIGESATGLDQPLIMLFLLQLQDVLPMMLGILYWSME